MNRPDDRVARCVWSGHDAAVIEHVISGFVTAEDLHPFGFQTLIAQVQEIPLFVKGLEEAPQPPPDQNGVQRVYLICDQRDVEATQPLVDFLFSRFEVTLPVFDGDESQVRREHEANLAECDAVVVYYGAGNELLLRSKLRELQKIAGYGRTKPMLAKAIYVAPPDAPEKQRLRTHDALVIRADAAFTPSLLEPFVDQLTQARQVS